jgi:DNA-binding response OmpR family regulator
LTGDATRRRILVLSDNDKLSKAISWNLEQVSGQEVVRQVSAPNQETADQLARDGFDLVVVAVSAVDSEPIVTLAKASAAQYADRIPVLIVSDRPFRPDPDARIAHLDFPFEPAELRDAVVKLLHREEGASTEKVLA